MSRRGFVDAAMAWCDRWWDPSAGLLWNPPGSFDEEGLAPRSMHMVPQSAWYAAGLLRRGDRAGAARVFDALCDLQYDAPGAAWDGTFARFAEWPDPQDGARQWIDYDPNWRQFLATTFALVLRRFDVGERVAARLRSAIARAVEGEPAGRVSAAYSNIALMKAWLEVEAGRAGGEAFGREVVERFRRHGAFDEYGSPTYYGIDLFGLALWRGWSSSSRLRAWGEEVEAALWRDVARWYHPGLRNLCGPYSRAYGMDMTGHVALLGLWLEAVAPSEVPRTALPVPDLARPFAHSHDLAMAPVVELAGARVPAGVVRALATFSGERTVRQQVTDERVATGWLAPDVMFGGEAGGRYRAQGQYVPATAHWRVARAGSPPDEVAWLRVVRAGPVDAIAAPGVLEVSYDGEAPSVESSHPFPGVIDDRPGRLVLRWRR